MKTFLCHESGFTLMEILLSAIIFIVSVAGVFATLDYVRQPVLQKERQLSATILGQDLLENLYNEVDATKIVGGIWQGNLALGTHQINATDNQGDTDTLNWTVSCADGSNTCDTTGIGRKVALNITYQ